MADSCLVTAQILDGKATAAAIKSELAVRVAKLAEQGVVPGLGTILVEDPIIKTIGFGLTIGVLIDAFVVRMTLVPAVLTLLGDRAWSFPKWLDRITPKVDIEGESLRTEPPKPTKKELVSVD